jgi:uncharacterized integral membrane protein
VTDDQHAERSQNRLQPHHIVIGVCLVVLLLFAILNIDDVRVDFAVDTVAAPLVLVIAICALLGFVIGWFVGRRRHRDE